MFLQLTRRPRGWGRHLFTFETRTVFPTVVLSDSREMERCVSVTGREP